jgi:3'-5' exoribonuclease
MRYLEDIRENEQVIEHYLCRSKQTLKTRGGKTYLSLRLSDKTGTMDAKVWEMNNDIQSFDEGDMVKIDAQVATFQNELQLKVSKLRKSREGEYIPMNYVACTEKDIPTLYAQVCDFVKSVQHPKLRRLLEILLVEDESRAAAFQARSAAKQMHHAYMGGLLEHTLHVAQLCEFLVARYKHVNRDLLITTALLHDIGKIHELSEMPMNDYTDDGQLLGHITIGVQLIHDAVRGIEGFPPELATLVKHSILAHHGEYEYGSPKLPATIEAYLLHCADNLDAKIKSFEEILDKDATPGRWTGYQKMLNRYVRRSDYDEK